MNQSQGGERVKHTLQPCRRIAGKAKRCRPSVAAANTTAALPIFTRLDATDRKMLLSKLDCLPWEITRLRTLTSPSHDKGKAPPTQCPPGHYGSAATSEPKYIRSIETRLHYF